jgi:hypothetical protein
MDDNSVAIIAVVVTGGVTLFNGLVNVIIPVWIEHNKAKEAKAAARLERIEAATLEFLDELSRFNSNYQIEEIEASANKTIHQVFSDLLAKYYTWERAIWSNLDHDSRLAVEEMRRKIERTRSPSDIFPEISGYSKKILTITYEATKDD